MDFTAVSTAVALLAILLGWYALLEYEDWRRGTGVALIIVAARKVVPFLLHHIVRLRSPDLFIIFVVLMSLGTAWLTSQFGLSLALGAFIAGMVLSESEYSHQVVARAPAPNQGVRPPTSGGRKAL